MDRSQTIVGPLNDVIGKHPGSTRMWEFESPFGGSDSFGKKI